MISRHGRLFFVSIVVFQILVLVGMAASKELTLRDDSTDVTLQTAPVDPRDLFRGDYAILSYEISTIDLDELGAWELMLGRGDVVYVELVEGSDGLWIADGIDTRPRASWDRFIRGSIRSVFDSTVFIEYGIEAYFVPEGRGGEIQFADDVQVVVALDDSGGAVIRHVIVDGERWER